jgi:hypothetical protein
VADSADRETARPLTTLGGVEPDIAAHRARAPWYRTKRTISVANMLAALRRALLATQYRQGQLDQHILDLFPAALVTDLDPAA